MASNLVCIQPSHIFVQNNYIKITLTFLVKRTTSDYSHISKELHRISLVLY
uniref:Uncharacterized protein n=1 Tax=uncultured marine virus TaxID=186617 RepID=A0A0F7L703_9VIRU|nr:hypothetical protein [uncultured marine virus]